MMVVGWGGGDGGDRVGVMVSMVLMVVGWGGGGDGDGEGW